MTPSLRDTHTHDWLLWDLLAAHARACAACRATPPAMTAAAYADLATQVRPADPTGAARRALALLSSDTPGNCDEANATDAAAVLATLHRHRADVPVCLLAEQLADIVNSGTCAQGRTTRLLALVWACLPMAKDVRIYKR